MSEILELADEYADEQHAWKNGGGRTRTARAALAAEVEKLEADRDQLQRDFTHMKQQRDELRAELQQITTEYKALATQEWEDISAQSEHERKLAAAEKDAARYRWLRNPRGGPMQECPIPVWNISNEAIWESELDAAIDAAMEATK